MTIKDTENPYEQLLSLDKEIISLEKKIWNYFIDNVCEKDKMGDIELPLIGNSSLDSNSGEYEKLRNYTNEIYLKINQTKQELNQIEYYTKRIRSEIVRDAKKDGEKLSDDEIELMTKKKADLYIKELMNHIENLKERLKLINENQKMYIRFKDYQECNFEMIKSDVVKNKLRKMKKELLEKKQERNRISKSIKSNLGDNDIEQNKEKKPRLCMTMFPKKSKKSIDN